MKKILTEMSNAKLLLYMPLFSHVNRLVMLSDHSFKKNWD